MLQVFIDTNIYLTFFSFTEEDLEELRKLHVAIDNGEVQLWMTDQVQDELRRNREGKVADSLARLRKLKPPGAMPQMARNLPDFDHFVKARREFEGQLSALDASLTAEFFAGTLAADQVLRELVDSADPVVITEEVVTAARRRIDLGNPPGKKGSLGDAINWECLLANCPRATDLHLVTADSDYISKMSDKHVSTFLAEEWRSSKDSEVILHPRISSFFRDHFPAIELATELEKEFRIRSLLASQSFAETHQAIDGLEEYTEYSDDQARQLLAAATTNSQIRRILRDSDVGRFFRELLRAHRQLFEGEELKGFERSFGRPFRYVIDDDDEDVPG